VSDDAPKQPLGRKLAQNIAAQGRAREAERVAWAADAPGRRLAELFAELQSRAAVIRPGEPVRVSRVESEGLRYYSIALGAAVFLLSEVELAALQPAAWPALEARIYEALHLGPVLPTPSPLARLDGPAWVAAVLAVFKVGLELENYDLPALIAAAAQAEALGPVLNPTLYQAKGADLAHDRAWLEAALPLWRHAREARRQAVEVRAAAPLEPLEEHEVVALQEREV
jgi:hypothetical protein